MEYLGKIFVKQFETDFTLCIDNTDVIAMNSDIGCWGTDLETKDYESQPKFVWFVCLLNSKKDMQNTDGIKKYSLQETEYRELINNYNTLVDKIFDIKVQIETCIGRLNRLRQIFKTRYINELQNLAEIDMFNKHIAAEITWDKLVDRHFYKLKSEFDNGKEDIDLQGTFDFFLQPLGDINWKQFVKQSRYQLQDTNNMLQWRGLEIKPMEANTDILKDKCASVWLRRGLIEQIGQLKDRIKQMQAIYRLASKTEMQYRKYVNKLNSDIDSGIFQLAVKDELDCICNKIKLGEIEL